VDLPGPLAATHVMEWPQNYTPEKFCKILVWQFLAYLDAEFPIGGDGDAFVPNDTYSFAATASGIQLSNQCADYRFRSPQSVGMVVWDYIELVQRVSCNTAGYDNKSYADGHRLRFTHKERHRANPWMAYPSGSKVPRPDTQPEQWAKWIMCLLGPPWRNASDLKTVDQSWQEALDAYDMPPWIQQRVQNVMTRHRSHDAKKAAAAARKEREEDEDAAVATTNRPASPSPPCEDDDMDDMIDDAQFLAALEAATADETESADGF